MRVAQKAGKREGESAPRKVATTYGHSIGIQLACRDEHSEPGSYLEACSTKGQLPPSPEQQGLQEAGAGGRDEGQGIGGDQAGWGQLVGAGPGAPWSRDSRSRKTDVQ